MEYKRRQRNRLKNYDYSQSGYYFVTICTWGLFNYFGQIINDKMGLNQFGLIVKKQWNWVAEHYPYVQLDDFVIMPNHIHGIIIINRDIVRNGCNHSARKIKPLPELMGAFKTTSSKLIHNAGLLSFRWKRSFYDHIIRNEKDLYRIREYIDNNPFKWHFDRNHPEICN